MDKINFWVDEKEILALVGPSGSGKTLTLSSILQLNDIGIFNQSGQINYHTSAGEIDLLDTKVFREIRREHIGYVFQQSMEVLNPRQRIGAQLMEKSILKDIPARAEVEGLMQEMGLDPERFFNAYPHQMSGGEIQRTLLVLALINSPRLLLADEPFSNVDQDRKAGFINLFRRLKEQKGMAILLVSHDVDSVNKIADRVVYIDEGKTHYDQQYGNHKVSMGALIEKEDPELLLSVASITKSFKSQKVLLRNADVTALENFSFNVYRGEILGLIGPSGCGKSTLGRIIAKLDEPDKGDIYYNGKAILNLSKEEMSDYRSKVQIIFQDPLSSMPPHRKVSNFLLDAYLAKGMEYDLSAISDHFDKFQLSLDLLHRLPTELSGGQRQRIMIIRALIMGAELLICDEITSSLDNEVAFQVLVELRKLNESEGMTVIFISHDLTKANALCHRIENMH